MIQEILTYMTIVYALGYVVFNAYNFFKPVPKGMHDCSTGCSACSLKEVHLSAEIKTRHYRKI
jgi:hypothetical protein